ncbi:hypothetical protein [Ahrensia kielensis]|uniref:hypothetical protein n=1 Tax=Ahrensia kielensis TaxID=76980 RepID=UPI00037484DB|nr:hypothetical protein [Ahrensia kielensis]
MTIDAPLGIAVAQFTKDYLLAIEEELEKTNSSAELIEAMTTRFPELGMGVALSVGAKGLTGEMKWG